MRTRARIDFDIFRNIVRLQIVRESPTAGSVEALMEDGTWQTVPHGTAPSGEPGVPLPADVLPVVAEAVNAYLGNSVPSQAEVAVLREWLAKEQGRVDEKWSAS